MIDLTKPQDFRPIRPGHPDHPDAMRVELNAWLIVDSRNVQGCTLVSLRK